VTGVQSKPLFDLFEATHSRIRSARPNLACKRIFLFQI
jgi:hypothetical protein